VPLPLAGKNALVTGAAKGIGREIALELARRGCDVAINDYKDGEGAEETARQVRALGRQALVGLGSVGRAEDVDRIFADIFRHFGRLHILVNNAGVQTWKGLLELEEAEWDRTIETNLKGVFLCTQRAGRHMKEHGGGRIVNLGSGSNKFAFPKLVDYTASRGGVEMFTKSAAIELGRWGITVNCVAPGPIETERTRQESPDYAADWAPLTAVKRIGQPSDVASAICYLAADEAEFVTGQTLFVDGGVFSRSPWAYQD
jgi:NAD(P)-dependent dehydrogenase (short-subunit alcohol dehydrogenase family)